MRYNCCFPSSLGYDWLLRQYEKARELESYLCELAFIWDRRCQLVFAELAHSRTRYVIGRVALRTRLVQVL